MDESRPCPATQGCAHHDSEVARLQLRQRAVPGLPQDHGWVVVQGIKTNDPEHRPAGMPDHEGVLFIPDDAWERLNSRLFQQATGGST